LLHLRQRHQHPGVAGHAAAAQYCEVAKPDEDFDMKDWPRIAKIQSDLLA
jgi:hypothetical protein